MSVSCFFVRLWTILEIILSARDVADDLLGGMFYRCQMSEPRRKPAAILSYRVATGHPSALAAAAAMGGYA